MNPRKIFALTLGPIFALSGALSATASVPSVGDPGQGWSLPNDAALGEHIQMFLDTPPGEKPSYLFDPSTPTADTQGRDYIQDPTCSNAEDGKCAGKDLQYEAVLPKCSIVEVTNCVLDFGTIDQAGIKTSATFSQYFPQKALNQYTGNPKLHLPSGVAGSLYSLNSATHDGGNLYYVAFIMQGNGSSTRGFSTWNFEARVYPIQIQDVDLGSSTDNQVDAGFGFSNRGRSDGTKYWGQGGPGFTGKQFCVASSGVEKKCAARFAFPSQLKFYLKVRVQQLPGGWMHGRMQDPSITITKGTSDGLESTDLEISAAPVAVPLVYKMYNWNDMPLSLRSNYDTGTGAFINDPGFKQDPVHSAPGGRSAPNSDPLKRNVILASEAWTQTGMEQLKLWLPYVNDQATALPSYWSVRNLTSNEMQGSNQCFSDQSKVTGIVTTNATQYSAGPPAFDKSSGVLNYKVASPHYTTQRDVFKGTYDLLMRSEVARCVYGFSNAPVRADISVTSADGSSQVVSTTLTEAKGWMHLSANNFEFSAPQINVKLLQDAPVVAASASPSVSAAPSPATSDTPAPQASSFPTQIKTLSKTTIVCVKGKISKLITAARPMCPTGYKKK